VGILSEESRKEKMSGKKKIGTERSLGNITFSISKNQEGQPYRELKGREKTMHGHLVQSSEKGFRKKAQSKVQERDGRNNERE